MKKSAVVARSHFPTAEELEGRGRERALQNQKPNTSSLKSQKRGGGEDSFGGDAQLFKKAGLLIKRNQALTWGKRGRWSKKEGMSFFAAAWRGRGALGTEEKVWGFLVGGGMTPRRR